MSETEWEWKQWKPHNYIDDCCCQVCCNERHSTRRAALSALYIVLVALCFVVYLLTSRG